ncbi:MAG: hypothetical protein MK212_14045 [Saprospiraceae bacterium]|nr:hypothetical protein [Saprospiraceae bacterium]
MKYSHYILSFLISFAIVQASQAQETNYVDANYIKNEDRATFIAQLAEGEGFKLKKIDFKIKKISVPKETDQKNQKPSASRKAVGRLHCSMTYKNQTMLKSLDYSYKYNVGNAEEAHPIQALPEIFELQGAKFSIRVKKVYPAKEMDGKEMPMRFSIRLVKEKVKKSK